METRITIDLNQYEDLLKFKKAVEERKGVCLYRYSGMTFSIKLVEASEALIIAGNVNADLNRRLNEEQNKNKSFFKRLFS